jgi:hypothetical protein
MIFAAASVSSQISEKSKHGLCPMVMDGNQDGTNALSLNGLMSRQVGWANWASQTSPVSCFDWGCRLLSSSATEKVEELFMILGESSLNLEMQGWFLLGQSFSPRSTSKQTHLTAPKMHLSTSD